MIEATVDEATISQPQYGLLVERDVEVPMRDGLNLKSDIFRPDDNGKFPVIMTLGPYPKNEHSDYGAGAEEKSQYMTWETANPEWWVPRGYVEINVDARGSGVSPGFCDILSPQETEDYYDAIEWAARQAWCDGNIGLMGISYYAVNQWNVAALAPPHLKAMIPWEGWGDLYRDAARRGSILHDGFFKFWHRERVVDRTQTEGAENWREQFSPFFDELQDNPLDGAYYHERSAHWDKVKVPFLSVGNWGNRELHLRGNTEGFMRAAAKEKRLRIHTGTHIAPFYWLEGRLDQIRFLDYWLKGMDNGLDQDPPVKLAIRTTGDDEVWRFENEWPIARTQWTKFYLNESGGLGTQAPAEQGSVSYSAEGPRDGQFRGAQFVTSPMEEEMEITGPVNLVMWASATSDDMDFFGTLHNLAPDGMEVRFPNGMKEASPLSKGWFRASHRKLDEALSTPWRPYHSHDEVQKLTPGEVVRLEVEILPLGNIIKKGHRLRGDIQPWDDSPDTRYSHDNQALQKGEVTILTGADRASFLLLSVIPAKN